MILSLLYIRLRVLRIFVKPHDNYLDFGTGSFFCWSNQNGFAAYDNNKIRIFDASLTGISNIEPDYPVEGLYGGNLLYHING